MLHGPKYLLPDELSEFSVIRFLGSRRTSRIRV